MARTGILDCKAYLVKMSGITEGLSIALDDFRIVGVTRAGTNVGPYCGVLYAPVTGDIKALDEGLSRVTVM